MHAPTRDERRNGSKYETHVMVLRQPRESRKVALEAVTVSIVDKLNVRSKSSKSHHNSLGLPGASSVNAERAYMVRRGEEQSMRHVPVEPTVYRQRRYLRSVLQECQIIVTRDSVDGRDSLLQEGVRGFEQSAIRPLLSLRRKDIDAAEQS